MKRLVSDRILKRDESNTETDVAICFKLSGYALTIANNCPHDEGLELNGERRFVARLIVFRATTRHFRGFHCTYRVLRGVGCVEPRIPSLPLFGRSSRGLPAFGPFHSPSFVSGQSSWLPDPYTTSFQGTLMEDQ